MLAIGVMSGTSLDGVDVALCEVESCKEDTKIVLKDFLVYEIPLDTKARIKQACLSNNASTRLICSLNFELGYVFSNAVKALKDKNNLKDEDIDFIATHGQTIYHLPIPSKDEYASTLQIGEPAIMAYQHKTKVISNFRVMDMASGGLGAPLVPYSEKILYGQKGKKVVLQNIGGIGNLTYISDDEAIAFDTGPGNMMIDQAMDCLYQQKYDKNGEIGAKGNVDQELLDHLMSHPFIAKLPPKTTGREDFGQDVVEALIKDYKDVNPCDFITTLTAFTAKSIAYNYKHNLPSLPDIAIIGGGGAYNKTLLKMIQDELPSVDVKTQEDCGYSSDAKEAIAFVILGNETLHGNPSNVIEATGAKHPVVLGQITLNPFSE